MADGAYPSHSRRELLRNSPHSAQHTVAPVVPVRLESPSTHYDICGTAWDQAMIAITCTTCEGVGRVCMQQAGIKIELRTGRGEHVGGMRV